jgi:ParB family chromosome partitioning protein
MVDRRLGRGLEFFLTNRPATNPAAPAVAAPSNPPAGTALPAQSFAVSPEAPRTDSAAKGDGVLLADIQTLVPSPFQPRSRISPEELAPLVDSIRASGVLQPILARRVGDRLEIVAGERRWRAATAAGLAEVPVLVRTISDDESAVFGLVENIQREDLNAIEKALGFRVLMGKLAATQEEVAKRVGLERSTVANFLRLLDLPDEVQAHVSRGTLSMGHARCLLALPSPDLMVQCATECIKQAWSVRKTEAEVKSFLERAKGTATANQGSKRARPVWLNELEESLVEALGASVSIRYGRKKSQIVIECAGRDEFERIFQKIKNS